MNILVIDDHQLFLDGLRHVLSGLNDHVEIMEAHNAEEAFTLIDGRSDIDLVLLDLNMPHLDGVAFLKGIKERELWIPCVVISAEEDPRLIKLALDTGALGFIPKSHSSSEMISALHLILGGDIYLPEETEEKINRLEAATRHKAYKLSSQVKDFGITKRQREVLLLMAKGYSNKKIATTLYLTEHTVKSHITALFHALNAANRTECVKNAEQYGLLEE